MKKALLIAAAAFSLSLFLAACGGGNADRVDKEAEKAEAETEETEKEETGR